jgi:hypothetical protein
MTDKGILVQVTVPVCLFIQVDDPEEKSVCKVAEATKVVQTTMFISDACRFVLFFKRREQSGMR